MTPSHLTSHPRVGRRARHLVPAAILVVALAAPAAASAAPSTAPGSAAPGASTGACYLVAPTPGPSPSTSPGASVAPLPVRKGTIPAAGGILEPGATYTDYSLGPTLTFTAGDCWAATPVDAGFGLALVWGGSGGAAVLTFTEFEGLVFEDPCQATSDKVISIPRTPEALANDLMANPSLITGEPTDITVSGFSGLRLELATQQPMECQPPVTWTWASTPYGGFVLQDGEQATFELLQVGERTLVISWEAYTGADFEAFSAAAEAVVATLTIDASTDPGIPSPAPTRGPAPSDSPAPAASAAPDATSGPAA